MSPLPLFRPVVGDNARQRAAAVLDSGWLGYGPQCRALEQRFLRGAGFALATGSCTAALYLAALLIRGRRDAPEVIVPAVTFIATGMAFAHAGFRVRVADVDRATGLVCPASVERLVGPRTAAVVVVHLFGQRADVAPLRALCDRHALALVEDCAHRIDLDDAGPRVADFACFSFNAVKEIPAGEGGILWARDTDLEPRARSVSNTGLAFDTLQRSATARHRDYRFTGDSGLKLRSNDVAAALALGALDEWREARALRLAQFARYDALLAPLAPHVVPLARRADDSGLMYVVRARERGRLQQSLADAGIATSVHYPSLARHPAFEADADASARDDAVDGDIVTLPTSLALTAAMQQRVADAATASLVRDRCHGGAADVARLLR